MTEIAPKLKTLSLMPMYDQTERARQMFHAPKAAKPDPLTTLHSKHSSSYVTCLASMADLRAIDNSSYSGYRGYDMDGSN